MTLASRIRIAVLAITATILVAGAAGYLSYQTARADTVTVVDAGALEIPAPPAGSVTPPAPEPIALVPTEATAPSHVPELEPGDLFAEAYRGITTGDWFLLAGAVLSLLVLGAWGVIKRRVPDLGSDRWGVAITAALAGFGALGHAWLADAPLDAQTWLGALKVWAAAVFAYVTTRKLLTAPSSAAKRYSAVALVALLVACGGGLREGSGRVAGDVVDCMTPAAQSAIGELGPAFGNVIRNATSDDGKVDWAPVKAAAAPLKSQALQCALAATMAELMRPRERDPNAPQSSPLEVDVEDLRAGWESIRIRHYGGATFKLPSGEL